MAQGQAYKPFKYRISVPNLVRLINIPILSKYIVASYEIAPLKLIKLKFAIINMLAIALTSLIIYRFCLYLGYGFSESLIGGLLYINNYFVANIFTIPSVDAPASMFLMLGILAIVRNKYLILFFTVLIGMFVKESNILLLFENKKNKIRKFLLSALAIVPYIIFRNYIVPTDIGYDQFSFKAIIAAIIGNFTCLV